MSIRDVLTSFIVAAGQTAVQCGLAARVSRKLPWAGITFAQADCGAGLDEAEGWSAMSASTPESPAVARSGRRHRRGFDRSASSAAAAYGAA